MCRKTVIDISRLAASAMLACAGMSVWAAVSSPVGPVSGRQITVTGKPEIEYVRTQNRVQVKSLPVHSDLDNDPLSDWRYVWKIDGTEVKAEANASSDTTIPVHPILQGQYNKPAMLCLKAVTSSGYPEETRTSDEACSDEVQLTNSAPTATNVTVNGALQVGQELGARFTYSDADGDIQSSEVVRWYRSDDATGSNKALVSGQDLGGSYRLVAADEGKYLSFEVVLGALTGLSPVSAESPLVGPIAPRLIDSFATPDSVQRNWSDANIYCSNLGFRLPTKDELVALYNQNTFNTINTVHGWPGTSAYWSDTLHSPGYYYTVDLSFGAVHESNRNFLRYVTCVR